MHKQMVEYFSCGMVHQAISRRVLRVVGVVVPLMLAVLPYARGRGFDSRFGLYCVNQFVFLFSFKSIQRKSHFILL
jgi:hypothetical protein